MKLLISFFLFLNYYTFSCFANNSNGSVSELDSVRLYYEFTNKAELAIVDSNYTLAQKEYANAFMYKYPNQRDIYNAGRVGIIVDDTAFAMKCLLQLARNGYSINHIDVGYGGEAFKDQYPKFKKLKKELEEDSVRYYDKNKAWLAAYFVRMYRRDQNVRREDTFSMTKARSVDQLNIDTISWFDQRFGFPGNKLLGGYDPCGGIGTHGIFGFIYWHNRGTTKSILDTMGMKAVLSGEYPPDEFAYVYDSRFNPSKYYVNAIFYMDTLNTPMDSITENQANKSRKEIYLEPLADFRKKLEYMKKQGKRWYNFKLMSQLVFVANSAKLEKY